MTGEIPDLFEPMLVFRFMNLGYNGTLCSLAYPHNWHEDWNNAGCGIGYASGHKFPVPMHQQSLMALPTHEFMDTMDSLVHGSSPAPYCSCGFYAYYFPGQIYLAESVTPFVTNQREWPPLLWSNQCLAACHVKGRMQLYDNGMRAQRMKLLAVASFAPDRMFPVTTRYPGVKVLPSPVELLEAYPPQDYSDLVGADVKPWPFGPPVTPKRVFGRSAASLTSIAATHAYMPPSAVIPPAGAQGSWLNARMGRLRRSGP